MALLILQHNRKGQVSIDGVSIDINHDHILVNSLPNSLITSQDIVKLLDNKHIRCEVDVLGGVIIPKPVHASRLSHWASIH